MIRYKFATMTMAILCFAMILNSCGEDDVTNPPSEFIIEQGDLNEATTVFELGVIGAKYGPATIAHNGNQDASVFDTYRDIFTNIASNDVSNIKTGDIITKRVYARNADGTKGDLLVTFAMVKRESGYDPDNGDWEYIMMPAGSGVDYSTMPNGMLPEAETEMRGKIAMCQGCHNLAADGSGLFIRNEGEITATQEDIDNTIREFELNITGDKYGDATIAHGGQDLTSDDTFRDIYVSWATNDQPIAPGNVITKSTYIKNQDGSKGNLAVTFAMIKREAGYWPDGGDWEYAMMPNDGSTNYDEMPNGMLPEEGSAMRGKLEMCAGCHAQAPANNYLFIRN